MNGNASVKQLDPQCPWPATAVTDLDDAHLAAAARAAFAWYRQALDTAGVTPDETSFAHLVTLQREYMHRFPDGDLSG